MRLKQVLKRGSLSTFRCGHEQQVRCYESRDGNISECRQILVKPSPYCGHDLEVIFYSRPSISNPFYAYKETLYSQQVLPCVPNVVYINHKTTVGI